MEVNFKEKISQEPSEGMKPFILDLFKEVGVGSSSKEIRVDKSNYEKVTTKVSYPLDGSISQDDLKRVMKEKMSNYVAIDAVDVKNDKDFIFVFFEGYMDKFHPIKFYKFIKHLVKNVIYDSHKMNIASEDKDKIKIILAHSYSYSFENAVVINVDKACKKFKTIKEYEVKQHPNYKDSFEVVIRGELLEND